MYRRCYSSAASASRSAALRRGDIKAKKKDHWKIEVKAYNNVQRALTHFDDFYASVFGRQWPSMRLGLLTPPKYMAIPNAFTGNIEVISKKLQDMGAYSVPDLWRKQQVVLEAEKREIDLKKDLGRLHQMDRTLEAIAATKKAEEMDVLYQNAPTSKREDVKLGRGPLNRLISNVDEAASDFVPSTKLKGVDDFTFDSEYFASYLKSYDNPEDDNYGQRNSQEEYDVAEIQFLKSPISTLEIPHLLVPHSFENGSSLMFPAAGRDRASNFREYICINGASMLPVIALDLRPGINLLDLCAGPGTKSLLCLMTMTVDAMTCNDLESSRLNRIKRIMEEFSGSRLPPSVSFTTCSARNYPADREYARVLVDVPCLNDRISCTVLENNIFKSRRTKERLSLVNTQKDILLSGFRALNQDEGSAVVYSTCTLSPIENDGVVMNALKETEVLDLHVDLIGLVKLVQPFERAGLFRIMRTRCGILVLPNTFNNFGPMYVSRIVMKPFKIDPSENSSVENKEDASQ